MVEKTPKMYEVLTKVSEEDTVEYGENMCYIPVRFDTGLGRGIYRQYAIDSSQCRMLMEEVCRDSDYINWKYGFLNIKEKYSGNFTLSNSLMDEQIIKKGEKEEFLENLRKDIKDANAETFTALPCALLYLTMEFCRQHRIRKTWYLEKHLVSFIAEVCISIRSSEEPLHF